MYSVAIVAI
jgi:trimethylamine---corrinoid protein Co-methyltransferase